MGTVLHLTRSVDGHYHAADNVQMTSRISKEKTCFQRNITSLKPVTVACNCKLPECSYWHLTLQHCENLASLGFWFDFPPGER